MFPARPTKKRIKIMTPRGEAENIRVAQHSGVMYFEKRDSGGIFQSYTLEECEIIIEVEVVE